MKYIMQTISSQSIKSPKTSPSRKRLKPPVTRKFDQNVLNNVYFKTNEKNVFKMWTDMFYKLNMKTPALEDT